MGLNFNFNNCVVSRALKIVSNLWDCDCIVALLSQLLALPYENYVIVISNAGGSSNLFNSSNSVRPSVVHQVKNVTNLYDMDGVSFNVENVLAIDRKMINVEVDLVLGFHKSGTSTNPEKRLSADSTIGFHLNISTCSRQGEIRNQSAQLLQLKPPAALPSVRENVTADTGNSVSSNDKGLVTNQATSFNLLQGGSKLVGASIMDSKRRRPTSISYMNSLLLQNSINLVVWLQISILTRVKINYQVIFVI